MTTRRRPPMVAADHIREMIQAHTTTTTVHRDDGTTELHRVTEPPLIDQLSDAITGSSSKSDEDAGRASFRSKPAAHLEAMDALDRIDQQARRLAGELGLSETGPLEGVLSRISGEIGFEPHPRVRSWWATARMLTQHDAPPLRPHGVPCPVCWETNSLRIRLDEEMAVCTRCGENWDRSGEPSHGSLDVLAQHVSWCAEHEVTRPEHLTMDPSGARVECTECIPFRISWSDWRHAQDTRVASGDTLEV